MSHFWGDVLFAIYIIALWEWVVKPVCGWIRYPYRWRCSACPTRLRSDTASGLHFMKEQHLKSHGF